MKNRAFSWIVGAMVVLFMVPAFAGTVIYVNVPPPTDGVFGTMYCPCGYYASEVSPATAGGNALDNARVYMYDIAGGFQMLKWDMGFATNLISVYPDVEHGWTGDGHDYLQWSLWGSNTGAENPADWTLLWDVMTATGTSAADLTAATYGGAFDTATIYRLTNPGIGTTAYGDAFTIAFTLPTEYQYFGVRVSSYSSGLGAWDPEINALAAPVPEPASLLLLGTGLCGIAARLRRKK